MSTDTSDLGISGAHASDRDGFQHLVSEVALGHAGIVLGLEVSRLARNNVTTTNVDNRSRRELGGRCLTAVDDKSKADVQKGAYGQALAQANSHTSVDFCRHISRSPSFVVGKYR